MVNDNNHPQQSPRRRRQTVITPNCSTNHKSQWDHSSFRCSQLSSSFRRQEIPVFWLNIDAASHRRKQFHQQLDNLRLRNQRISAVTPNSTINFVHKVNVEVLQSPTERSCLASHLLAIYAAVYDTTVNPSSRYALIVEDDVVFEFDVK